MEYENEKLALDLDDKRLARAKREMARKKIKAATAAIVAHAYVGDVATRRSSH